MWSLDYQIHVNIDETEKYDNYSNKEMRNKEIYRSVENLDINPSSRTEKKTTG